MLKTAWMNRRRAKQGSITAWKCVVAKNKRWQRCCQLQQWAGLTALVLHEPRREGPQRVSRALRLSLIAAAASAQECLRGNCRGPDTHGIYNYASGADYDGSWSGDALRHRFTYLHGGLMLDYDEEDGR